MALIVSKVPTINGTTLTLDPAASGDTAEVGDDITLLVHNGGGGSINLTITTPGTLETGAAYPDTVIAIGAGVYKLITLPRGPYRGEDGTAELSWSATTDVTRAVIRR